MAAGRRGRGPRCPAPGSPPRGRQSAGTSSGRHSARSLSCHWLPREAPCPPARRRRRTTGCDPFLRRSTRSTAWGPCRPCSPRQSSRPADTRLPLQRQCSRCRCSLNPRLSWPPPTSEHELPTRCHQHRCRHRTPPLFRPRMPHGHLRCWAGWCSQSPSSRCSLFPLGGPAEVPPASQACPPRRCRAGWRRRQPSASHQMGRTIPCARRPPVRSCDCR
mmetsp:Transcript_14163/g.32150  ORF Transcript_14163/g.32150 Transcript_14163/m.32150 type:complete len:218 (-) Transcript_14163:193-846(-)